MYFAIGGRQRAVGAVSRDLRRQRIAPRPCSPHADGPAKRARACATSSRPSTASRIRRPSTTAWPHLGDDDRFIRWAARTAIEHQPLATWAEQGADRERIRRSRSRRCWRSPASPASIPQHRKPTDPPVDTAMRAQASSTRSRSSIWTSLTHEQRLTLVRTYRDRARSASAGRDDASVAAHCSRSSIRSFPPPTPRAELAALRNARLSCRRRPSPPRRMALIAERADAGGADGIRALAAHAEGRLDDGDCAPRSSSGSSRPRTTAAARASRSSSSSSAPTPWPAFTDAEKTAARRRCSRRSRRRNRRSKTSAAVFAGRTPITTWTLDELSAAASTELKGRNFENGRKMFAAAGCFTCHRFGNEGGMTGPDLTGAGGRYSAARPARSDHQPEQGDQRAVRAQRHHQERRRAGHRHRS